MTSSRRMRKLVAVACIALVVFAAFASGAASHVVAVVLIPVGLVIPTALITVVRREAVRSDVQPVALLSLVLFRAPPPESARS